VVAACDSSGLKTSPNHRGEWGLREALQDPPAAAGGWQDTEALLKCYQQPDNETLLAVMSEERKVREIVSGA